MSLRTCVFCGKPIQTADHAVGMNERRTRRFLGRVPDDALAEGASDTRRWFGHPECVTQPRVVTYSEPMPEQVVDPAAEPVPPPQEPGLRNALREVIDALERAGEEPAGAPDYVFGFRAALDTIRTDLAIAAWAAGDGPQSRGDVTLSLLAHADRLVAAGQSRGGAGFPAGFEAAHTSAIRVLRKAAMA